LGSFNIYYLIRNIVLISIFYYLIRNIVLISIFYRNEQKSLAERWPLQWAIFVKDSDQIISWGQWATLLSFSSCVK
jgi:hypothetical protein